MSIVHGGLFADGQTLVAGFIAGILKHELVDSQDSRQDEASENVELSGVEIPAEEQVDKHGQLQADQNEDTFEMVEKAVEEQQEQHAEFTFRGSESPKKDNFIVDKQVGLSQATGGAENVPKRRTSSIDLPATPKLYQPPSLDELMEQLSAADPPPQHEAPFPTTEIEHDHAAEAEDPRLLNAVIGEPGIPNDDVDPIANLILATDLGEVDTGDISFEASEAQDLSTFDKEAVLDENIRLNSTYIVGGVLADGYPLIAGLTFGPSNLQGGHAEGTAVSDVDEQQNHVIPENSEGNVEVKDKITEISLEQSGFEQPVAEESAEAPVEAIESAEKPSEGLEASEKPSEDVEALLAAYDYKPAAPLAPDHSPDFPNEIPLESGGHEAEFSTKVHDEGYPKALEAIKLVDEQEKELSSEPRDPEEDDELVAVGEEAPHVHRLVVDPVGDALSEFGSNTSLKSFDPNEPGAGTPPELIAAAGIAEGIKFHATSKLNEYVVVGGLQSDGLPLIQGIQKAPIAPGEIKETNQTNPQKIEEKTEEKQEEQQGNNEENNDETTVTETTEEFHTARESLKDTLEEEEGFVKLISIKSECRDGQQGQVQLEHEKTPVNAEDIQIRVEEYDTKLESKVESNVIHDSPVHKSRSIPIIVEERVERNQQIPQGVGRPENNIQSEEDLREIEIRRENAPYGEKARQEPRVVIEPLERWASEEDLRAVGTDQSGQVPEKDPIQFEETAAAQRIDAENVAVLNGQQPTPTLPSGQNHSERVIPIRIQSEGTVKPAQNRTVREETVRTVQPEFTTEKFFETEGRLGDSGVHKSPTEPTDQSERVISTTVTQNTQIGPEEGNRGTVQNFDNRTVQNEGERNVPIRIVPAVNGSTLVVDLPSPSQESGFHSTNEVSPVPGTEPSSIISSILRNLRELKMSDKPKYDNIVERLRQLEEEMRLQHTGVPPDAQLTELVGKILQSEYPHSDLQIVVSASRKSTSHTQFYETETPGMVGLAPDQLRELQTKLMDKISGRNDYGKNVDAKDQPDDLKRRDANEEGWTNEDGTESVHKRTVRQITTTESSVKGIGDHPQPNGEFIRLKVNEQVYDGKSDPKTHQIRLIPIQRIPVKYF